MTEPAASQDRGTLTVADRVIERVASLAAREIDDVIARGTGWRTLTGRSLPRTTAAVAGGRSRIGVEIAAAWPLSLPDVTRRTRDHVQARVAALTGVDVVAVDVTVSDVLHHQPGPARLR